MAKTLTFTKSDFRGLRKQSQQGGGNKETVELSAKRKSLYTTLIKTKSEMSSMTAELFSLAF